MIFSSIYHTFSCKSEKHYDCFLSVDLLGIALSLLAIYISGIYYAFWCHDVSIISIVSVQSIRSFVVYKKLLLMTHFIVNVGINNVIVGPTKCIYNCCRGNVRHSYGHTNTVFKRFVTFENCYFCRMGAVRNLAHNALGYQNGWIPKQNGIGECVYITV